MKLISLYLTVILVFVSACKENKTKGKTSELDSISELYEEDGSQTPKAKTENNDSATFTSEDWAAFENALNQEFGRNIYDAFLPYEDAIDSCNLLDTISKEGYLLLFDKLVKENDLMLLVSCHQLMEDESLNSFMELISAYTNIINAESNLVIKTKIAISTRNIMRSKNVNPQLIVDEVTTTLGKHNFDKKICQVTAILFIMSLIS
jgi:hypothetical protein